jgi:hypothetical protein
VALELWLVRYLPDHPDATFADITAASVEARQEVYTWLFDSHSRHQQNLRIRVLLEEDAFDRILQIGGVRGTRSAGWCHRTGRPLEARVTGRMRLPI